MMKAENLRQLNAEIEECKADADKHWFGYIQATARLAKLREQHRRIMRKTTKGTPHASHS